MKIFYDYDDQVYLPLKSDAPHIDPYYGQNQTVQIGEAVSINCKIYNVANRYSGLIKIPPRFI